MVGLRRRLSVLVYVEMDGCCKLQEPLRFEDDPQLVDVRHFRSVESEDLRVGSVLEIKFQLVIWEEFVGGRNLRTDLELASLFALDLHVHFLCLIVELLISEVARVNPSLPRPTFPPPTRLLLPFLPHTQLNMRLHPLIALLGLHLHEEEPSVVCEFGHLLLRHLEHVSSGELFVLSELLGVGLVQL